MGKAIRTGFLATITVGMYLRILFQLFFVHNVISSLIGVLIFFVVFHFFYVDIYPKDNTKVILIMLTITLFEVIGLNFLSDIIMIGGVVVLNITILYLGEALRRSANDSIIFRTSEYFRSGGYMFTMGIAIAYSLFSIGLYHSFPFSCKDLNEQSGKVVELVTKPMNMSMFENQDAGQILSTTKVKDLLLVGKVLNIESDIKGIGPIETFKTRKNDLITKTIDDNKELNQGICEFSLNKLNEKLQYPGFQASVVLLMVAVTYPFLRIVIQIMSFIGLILFTVMKQAKIYKVQKLITEVEKIG